MAVPPVHAMKSALPECGFMSTTTTPVDEAIHRLRQRSARACGDDVVCGNVDREVFPRLVAPLLSVVTTAIRHWLVMTTAGRRSSRRRTQ